MKQVASILIGTPMWVYFVLAYGLYAGGRAFFVQTVATNRLVLVPLVFVGVSLSSLVPILTATPLIGVAWGLCVALGSVLGWFFLAPHPIPADDRRSVKVPGSPLLLVLFLAIFGVKFVFGYQSALHPEVASLPELRLVVFGISGVSTGIMAGRNAKQYIGYQRNLKNRIA